MFEFIILLTLPRQHAWGKLYQWHLRSKLLSCFFLNYLRYASFKTNKENSKTCPAVTEKPFIFIIASFISVCIKWGWILITGKSTQVLGPIKHAWGKLYHCNIACHKIFVIWSVIMRNVSGSLSSWVSQVGSLWSLCAQTMPWLWTRSFPFITL